MGFNTSGATLTAEGTVPPSQLPPSVKEELYVVADSAERLALDVQNGDECKQVDTGDHYIYDGTTWHKYPTGAGGTVSDFVSDVINFAYNTASPHQIFPLLAGDMIDKIEVHIDTPFDDVTSTLLVGTIASPSLVMGAAHNDPTEAGVYINDENFDIAGPETLRLTINPGVSTQGSGKVVFTLRR